MNMRSSVLYVNENLKSLRLMASILEDSGFMVQTATTPWEAIELIHTDSFALALLNYQLPEMTGAQLAQEIRALDPALPIVLLSGQGSIPAGELVYVDAHIGRGSSIEDLTHAMRELMDKDRAAAGPFEIVSARTVPIAPGSR